MSRDSLLPLFAAVPSKDPRERAKDSRFTGDDRHEKENETGLIVQQSNLSRFLVVFWSATIKPVPFSGPN